MNAPVVMGVGQASQAKRGRLHVYLGIAPGVGKTHAMLSEAKRLAGDGSDVVVGLVDTHGRPETEKMLEGQDVLPPRSVSYRGATFSELDVDGAIGRAPDVIVVDELPHSCVPGSRHLRRWEDVLELLDAGIDVITTLNVNHLDSLQTAVESLTGSRPSETVPDAVVAAADEIELVDVPPNVLRTRVLNAQTLGPEDSETALDHFYRADRIAGLRHLACNWLFENRPIHDMPPCEPTSETQGLRLSRTRVVVALDGSPEHREVLRRAADLSVPNGGELIGVHVSEPGDPVRPEPPWLAGHRRLLIELGGRYHELAGVDVAGTLLSFAAAEHATHLVLGASRHSSVQRLFRGSVIHRALRGAGPLEVIVVPTAGCMSRWRRPRRPRYHRVEVTLPRHLAAWGASLIVPSVIIFALVPFRSHLGLTGALLVSLIGVVGVALLGGVLPALAATAVAVGLADFYFAPPIHSFRVARLVDVVALVTFVIVGAAVGGLIDRLTRQGVHVARASAEAENLARLAARSMVVPSDLEAAATAVRRTFDLDGVAVFHRDGPSWQPEIVVGDVAFDAPAAAPQSVEIAPGRVLVLTTDQADRPETRLLAVFLDTLRCERQRAQLDVTQFGQSSTAAALHRREGDSRGLSR